MGPKRKPRGKAFQKGNRAAVGSKTTKQKPGWEFVEVRTLKLDKSMLLRYLTQSIHLTDDELRARLKNKDTPKIHKIIARMFMKLGESGDVYSFNVLMDRIVGPVAQKIEMDVNNPYLKMSDEELLAEKKRLATICAERLRQIETGNGMFYVNPPKDVTPQKVIDEPKSGEPGNSEQPGSGSSVASARVS